MAGDHELSRDVDIDLGGIFASIWRHKIKLLLAALIAALLAFVVLQVVSPRYKSEARILIRTTESPLGNPNNSNQAAQNTLDDSGIASQVQLLQSRTIARKVISDLNLVDNPEFNSALKKSVVGRLLSAVGLSDTSSAVTAEDRVLEAYYDKLKVHQAERARVIVVQFWSKDPKLAAEIPNRIADEYLATQEKLKRGAGPEELAKLAPELDKLKESVREAEAAAAAFRENSDILQGRDNTTLATQELSELATELGRVRSQLSRAEANAASVSRALRSGSLESAASVLQSPLIQRLRERQVTLNGQLAELSTTLLSGHPRIQSLRSQISTLNSQINREAEKVQNSLQQEAQVARDREADLIQRRNQLKSESGRVGKAQVELRSLEREAEAKRAQLQNYLIQFQEAKSRQSREFLPADAFIFARAQVQSKPYFPKKLPTIIGAFFGTLLLGSMFTLAGAVLSSGAARREHADRYESMRANEPVMEGGETEQASAAQVDAPSVAPTLEELGRPVPVKSKALSKAALTAKSINMLGHGRIAMVSPEGDVGSYCTVTFARHLASHGGTVIVLDMTGSGSASKIMLGSDEFAGLKDVMAGQSGFGEAIHSDRLSAAHVMPSGVADTHLATGGAEHLSTIIDALQSTYQYLIVDCGAADVSGLTRISDASTIHIINSMDADPSEISMTSNMLVHAGMKQPLVVDLSLEELEMAGLTAA
jgi:uncharacterized protein involved in exopolysaccharide biosynthesis